MTNQEAIDINTLIAGMFVLADSGWMPVREPTEQKVREAAERLRQRAYAKMGAGIPAEALDGADLRVIL